MWVADPNSPPSGRAVGGGTAPDLRRPSQWWKAPPPGTPLRHPHSEQRRPARAHTVEPVLGPNARTDRTRDTRVAEGRLRSGAVPPLTACPLGGLLGSATHVLWGQLCGCGVPTLSPWLACPVGAACRGGGGGPSPGGMACHRCEGRLVSGAVPPPAARLLGRAAGVPQPACPGCGRCGRGDPAPAPQRAPLRAGVARCGGGGRALPGGVPSTVVRGVCGQALPLPEMPAHWAGCWCPPPTCCGRGRVGVGAQHCPLGLYALRGLRAAEVVGGRPRGRWPATVVRGVWCQALCLSQPCALWGGRPGSLTTVEGIPPGDALPPPSQRATLALKGARCGAGAGSPRPHRPHPGHARRGTPAARPRGRAAGGGTAPDTRRPSQRWQATPPGDGPPSPPRHAAPTGHAAQGDSVGPPHPHTRAHSTWVVDPNGPPSGRAVGGGTAPDLRRPSQRWKAPPRGRPSATPTASNAGPQGRTLWGRCWVPTTTATAPGTHGSRYPGCPPQRTGGWGRDGA